jgi:hypothetical protein
MNNQDYGINYFGGVKQVMAAADYAELIKLKKKLKKNS